MANQLRGHVREANILRQEFIGSPLWGFSFFLILFFCLLICSKPTKSRHILDTNPSVTPQQVVESPHGNHVLQRMCRGNVWPPFFWGVNFRKDRVIFQKKFRDN